MKISKEVVYTETHEWVKMEGDVAYVGITDYAQAALGDIVYINLPTVGDDLNIGDEVCDIESVKAVSMLYSPVAGTIEEVNEELDSTPELLNQDCYQNWIVKVANVSEKTKLLTSEEYEEFVEKGE